MSWTNGEIIDIDDDDKVSHVVGSSGQTGNWKKFWSDHTNRSWPRTCQILGCGNEAEVGAHVYVKNCHQTFILPTCQTCNKDGIHDYPNWVSCKQRAVAVRIEQHDDIYE